MNKSYVFKRYSPSLYILVGRFRIRFLRKKEGVWKDPDNKEVLTFTNWAQGQPDNYRDNENYGMFWYSGKWNDAPAAYSVSYILCEFLNL